MRSENNTETSAAGKVPVALPAEISDPLDAFFTEHPDPAEIDELLWRMFFHATLYDLDRNGTAAYLEDYGRLKESLSQLVQRLHKINASK